MRCSRWRFQWNLVHHFPIHWWRLFNCHFLHQVILKFGGKYCQSFDNVILSAYIVQFFYNEIISVSTWLDLK
jgi:hypothetical protein